MLSNGSHEAYPCILKTHLLHKKISGWVCVRYRKHQISCLYSVLFTIGEESTSSSFTLERRGVLLGLKSFILNFFIKSKAYLDWFTLISYLVWVILSPKNWLNSPKSAMEKAWIIASFKEAISSFELHVMRRSSTYNKMIINEPLIKFK